MKPLPVGVRRSGRALAALLLIGGLAAPAPPPGAHLASVERAPHVRYAPPVSGRVTRPFEPHTPYGPGHRGVDHQVDAGEPVRAAAAGRVEFAGVVAGSSHVTIRHGDGVRTTYSYLDEILVRAGDRVGARQVVGQAGPRLHIGARRDGRYIDPLLLYGRKRAVLTKVPGAKGSRTAS